MSGQVKSTRFTRILVAVLAAALALASTVVPAPSPLHAAGITYTVNWNGDDSDANPSDGLCTTVSYPALCSLRAAIESANATPGADFIDFAIGTGPVTISPLSPLPNIIDAVAINGTSQPGYAGTPIVEIDGHLAGGGHGLVVQAGSNIQGLVINRFPGNGILLIAATTAIGNSYIGTDLSGSVDYGNGGSGIEILGLDNTIGGPGASARNVISGNGHDGIEIAWGSNNHVLGNYIGTNAAGNAALRNDQDGVQVFDTSYNMIGGPTLQEGNVISGNYDDGVEIQGSGAVENDVISNFIGTNASGTAAIPNGYGVFITGAAHDNSVGGKWAAGGGRNVISGNTGTGVLISQPDSDINRVSYNFIGTAADGATSLGNGSAGVSIWDGAGNVIGDLPDYPGGEGNLIAFNGAGGVEVTGAGAVGNVISGNSLRANGGRGIYLGGVLPLPNDPGDGDTGPNNQQNYPDLAGAFRDATSTTFVFSLNSTPNSVFTVEFFSSPSCDPSGNGEGATFLHRAYAVTTDGSGNSPGYGATIPTVVPVGLVITATAISATTGDTSEFSACRPVVPIQCVSDDSDCDSYPDAEDVHPNLYCPIMRADVNHDGTVNILDLAETAGHFMQNVLPAFPNLDQGPPEQFDYVINILDLAKQAAQYLKNVAQCP